MLASIKEIMEERKGTGEHSNPNAVLKGAELLGRHLAMFTDRLQVEPLTISPEPMSADEWTGKHSVASPAGAPTRTH